MAANDGTEVYIIAGLLAVGGLALLLTSGGGTTPQPKPGDVWGAITLPNGPAAGTNVKIGNTLKLNKPSVVYSGPGVDTYTYITLKRADKRIVYSGGLAALHLPPTATPMVYSLVSEQQQQPDGTIGPIMELMPFPGPAPTPSCGVMPAPGLHSLVVEIYGRKNPGLAGDDPEQFASPGCNPRAFMATHSFPMRVNLTL